MTYINIPCPGLPPPYHVRANAQSLLTCSGRVGVGCARERRKTMLLVPGAYYRLGELSQWHGIHHSCSNTQMLISGKAQMPQILLLYQQKWSPAMLSTISSGPSACEHLRQENGCSNKYSQIHYSPGYFLPFGNFHSHNTKKI